MKKHPKHSTGEVLPPYELFLIFKPGLNKKNFTYDSEKQLQWYRSKGIFPPDGLAALLMKLQNTRNNTHKAIIYDNTGALPRTEALVVVNNVIIKNLLNRDI